MNARREVQSDVATALRALALVLLLVAIARPALAFRIIFAPPNDPQGLSSIQKPPSDRAPFFHWDLREFPGCEVPFSVFVPVDPAAGGQSAAAMAAAFQRWEDVVPSLIGFVPAGPPPVPARTFGMNDWNVVVFADVAADFPVSRNVTAAITSIWRNDSGAIIESDIVLNHVPPNPMNPGDLPAITWINSPMNGAGVDWWPQGGLNECDVRTAMLHEIGHFIGLHHPPVVLDPADSSIMGAGFQVNPAGGRFGRAQWNPGFDDEDGANFLYTPDLGDAPDPFAGVFNRFPTRVHRTSGPPYDTLNDYPRYPHADGAEHLFGWYGPDERFPPLYQYERLGPRIDDHVLECEARPVDSYDDGVTISGRCVMGKLAGDLTVAMDVRTAVDLDGTGHGYVFTTFPDPIPDFAPMYLNGWFDWNKDGDWDGPGEYAIGTAPGAVSVIGPGVYLFRVTPPPNTDCDIWSRFRLDWLEDVGQVANIDGSLNLTRGAAQFGEVEDYQGLTNSGGPPHPRCYFHRLLPISVSLPGFQTTIGLERICHAPKPLSTSVPPIFPPHVGQDGFESTLTVGIDVNQDGTSDEEIGMTGPVYVTRSAPYVDTDGLRRIDTEMVALSLHGFSPTLGPITIRKDPNHAVIGRIKQTPAAAAAGVDVSQDYPADSWFDVFFIVESPTLGASAVIGPERVNAQITSVPPGQTDPDVDHDGVMNTNDNCPIDPNADQADCDSNGVGDACQLPDCNHNGRPDNCDLTSGSSEDCQPNGIPDECDIASAGGDCNGNSVPDACDLASHTSVDCEFVPPDGTARASLSTGGAEGTAAALYPLSVSANGRYVVFASQSGNLVANDTNGAYDVFLRDRDADGDGIEDEPGAVATIVVSARPDGAPGNGPSDDPALAAFLPSQQVSADGRFVVFYSSATDLVAGDTNGQIDVFIRDRDTDADGVFDEPGAVGTTRILGPGGVQLNGTSRGPTISANGRYVAFTSFASNVVSGGDININAEVYVYDRIAQTSRRVSVSSAGTQPSTGSSENAAISSNGRYVVFESTATSLVSGDTNAARDIFRHDRDLDADGIFDETGAIATVRVSLTSTGAQTPATSDSPSISADGSWAAFRTNGVLVPIDSNNAFDVYLVNVDAGPASLRRASVSDGGGQATGAGLDTRPGGGVSPDGTYVAFYSNAANLVPGDTNGTYDVFVHDVANVRTRRLSLSSSGVQGNDLSIQPVLAADNRTLIFVSNATNLDPADTNGQTDVYVRALHDCNANGRIDAFESAATLQAECYGNGTPDECEPDCNGNAITDTCEITTGRTMDVNGNGVPDACDCADGDGDSYPGPSCPGPGPLDCDDQDPTVHPGATEICNGEDDSCSAGVDEGCDDDGDDRCDSGMVVVGTPPTCTAGGGDCDDTDGSVWGRPGEANALTALVDKQTFVWAPPTDLGGVSVVYDTLASLDPANFTAAGICVESNGVDLQSTHAALPPAGTARFYLVRAQNTCPGAAGTGSLGTSSSGAERSGRSCP